MSISAEIVPPLDRQCALLQDGVAFARARLERHLQEALRLHQTAAQFKEGLVGI